MQIEADKDLSEVSSHVRSLSAFLQTSQPYLASWRTAIHASMTRLRHELNAVLAPKTTNAKFGDVALDEQFLSMVCTRRNGVFVAEFEEVRCIKKQHKEGDFYAVILEGSRCGEKDGFHVDDPGSFDSTADYPVKRFVAE